MENYQTRVEWRCCEEGQARTMASLAGIELSTKQISDYILIRNSRDAFFIKQSDQNLLHSLLDDEQRVSFCKHYDCIKFYDNILS